MVPLGVVDADHGADAQVDGEGDGHDLPALVDESFAALGGLTG